MLADCWLVGCLVFLNSKSRLKWLTCLDRLHGWRLPSLLSWSVVGWLVLAKRLTECWLTVGWWVAWCFVTSKSRLKWLTCLDWVHGWRLPSLLSWSVVGWLVLAKRLTECLADCWWVGGLVFFTAKLRLKTDWLVLISWLTAWLAAPLLA